MTDILQFLSIFSDTADPSFVLVLEPRGFGFETACGLCEGIAAGG